MGKLLGIAVKERSHAPMERLQQASVTTVSGVANDFRGKPSNRQVTLLAHESWQAVCQQLGEVLPWQIRRANLYIQGINLQQTAGQVIQIGQLKLLITQESAPCQRMREVHDGLFEAMTDEWHGGVCCQVLHDGEIKIGDKVEIAHDN